MRYWDREESDTYYSNDRRLEKPCRRAFGSEP
jgi:hypothetical protein